MGFDPVEGPEQVDCRGARGRQVVGRAVQVVKQAVYRIRAGHLGRRGDTHRGRHADGRGAAHPQHFDGLPDDFDIIRLNIGQRFGQAGLVDEFDFTGPQGLAVGGDPFDRAGDIHGRHRR